MECFPFFLIFLLILYIFFKISSFDEEKIKDSNLEKIKDSEHYIKEIAKSVHRIEGFLKVKLDYPLEKFIQLDNEDINNNKKEK